MWSNVLKRVFVYNQSNHFSSLIRASSAGAKGQNILESLYPNSTQNAFQVKEIKHTYSSSGQDEKFTGYIPMEDLDIKYMKSGGPGGQNVNKVNSKVEVRFHLDSATWIPDWLKERLKEKEKSRINKDGYFVTTSDKTRKQVLNQADCLDKIRTSIYAVSKVREGPTEEFLLVKAQREAKKKAAMVQEKRRKSMIKRDRTR